MKRGSAVAEMMSLHSQGVGAFAFMLSNVFLFLNALSGMIYVATLIDVLLRFSSRKSGGIIHDKIEISLFNIITLDVQSQR